MQTKKEWVKISVRPDTRQKAKILAAQLGIEINEIVDTALLMVMQNMKKVAAWVKKNGGKV